MKRQLLMQMMMIVQADTDETDADAECVYPSRYGVRVRVRG